jgi:exoribonuclease-2
MTAVVLLAGARGVELGRLLTTKGTLLRIEARGPQGVEVRKIERDAVVALLMAQVETLAEADALLATAQLRVQKADLDAAWTLFETRPTGLGELAMLLLGEQTPTTRDLAMLAIAHDDDGFAVERGQVHRRTAEQRLALKQQREARARHAVEIAPWLAQIDAVRSGRSSQGLDLTWTQRLEAYVRAPVPDDPAVAMLLRERSRKGADQPRDAADLLRELGVWDAHDDLELVRAGVADPWDATPSQLPVLTQGSLGLARLDLPFLTVDNDAPHEVDDALWCQREGEGWRIFVAIASPSLWLPPGSSVDREANRRGATLYHPRYVAGMLPDDLSREHASLLAGQWRPAIVFEIGLDAQGRHRDGAVREVEVRVEAAWSYDRVDAGLANQETGRHIETLRMLTEACRAAESERIRNGAYLLYKPDVEIRAPRHRPMTLREASQTSPARRMVTEAMVLCCAQAARFCMDQRLPVPFRSQPRPVQPPLPPGLYTDVADIHSILRTLQPTRTTTQPEAHGVLALPAYVQVSSPLRRYGDLVAHRQILSHLRGQPLPYSAAEVTARIVEAEAGQSERRQWQRRGERYFKLLWLAGRGIGVRLEAQLVRNLAKGQVLAFVPLLGLEVPVHAAGHHLGDAVALTVRSVHPGTGELQVSVASA